MTVRDALRAAERQLRRAGVPQGGTDACWLMCYALGERPSRLPVLMGKSLGPEELARFQTLVTQRAKRQPLAYVIGETEFMGLRVLCDPRAFVPRPDTETLVEAVVQGVKQHPALMSCPLTVLDLGTGTGCIAIALAHMLPRARVIATDVSAEALALARSNLHLHGLQARVELLQGQDLDPVVCKGLETQVSVLACNPPYIPEAELLTLDPEVAQAEPRLALDGGPDGLAFFRRVLPRLQTLCSLRLAAFEVGYNQAQAVSELLAIFLPGWRLDVLRDLSGCDRVVRVARD